MMPDTTHLPAHSPAHGPAHGTDSAVRSADLLARVKGVFAAKGFDGASMQDLARAAGISAGNFYRYFPSKNAIIEAMVETDMARLEADFAAIMRSPDPRATLIAAIRIHMDDDENDGALWAEIEAASLRKPEIGAISGRFQDAVIGHLIKVFALLSGATPEQAARDYAAHAYLIVLLIKGSVISACGDRTLPLSLERSALRPMVMRVIEGIVTEISGAHPDAILRRS